MTKIIQFVDNASKKVIEFEKEVVIAKRGNLKIWRDGRNIRMAHFGTLILDFNVEDGEVEKWHVQSITDANYIATVLSNLNYHMQYRLGYRPVNGGGYFEEKIGESWFPVGGEE